MSKLSGFERSSGRPLEVLYAGTDSQLAFVKRRFFRRVQTEVRLGRHFAGLVDRIARESDCQIAVAIQNAAARRFLPRGGYILPLWVTAIADCSRSILENRSTSLKTDLRKVRKFGLKCVEASDAEDFWFFWDRMYVPYARARFNDQALIEKREDFSKRLEREALRLFFVVHNGRRVAGGIGNLDCEVPVFRYVGILDADRRIQKLGVLPAIYIFELELARNAGFKFVNFGGCRPFLDDGVLQFKKKFDIRLENSSCNRLVYMKPLTIDDAVIDCFSSNPMIRLDGESLIATTFNDKNGKLSVADSLWRFNGSLLPGLDRIERVTLKSENTSYVQVLSANHS